MCVRQYLLLLLAVLLSVTGTASAQPGTLDPSFDGDGFTTLLVNDFSRAGGVAVQPDGKIVTAGSTSLVSGGTDFLITRYNADGSLDADFGTAGTVVTDLTGFRDGAVAVILQPDGKIVAVGAADIDGAGGNENVGLVRYNADGSLDAGFGTGGIVVTDLGETEDEGFSAAVLQPDGKILVSGSTGVFGVSDVVVARYNSDGSLDAGFGTGGIVRTSAGTFSLAVDIALQADGRIIAAASSDITGSFGPALIRYNADGSLDTGFDGDGIAPSGLGGNAGGVVIRPDGQLVLSGADTDFDGSTFSSETYLVQFNPDGSLDLGFGAGGVGTTAPVEAIDSVSGIALQPDGKVVLAGRRTAPDTFAQDLRLLRFDADGSLDAGFGTSGLILADFGSDSEGAKAVALQTDGKIILGGDVGNALLLARYLGGGNAVTITLTPLDAPIVIGPGGGTFQYRATVTNESAVTQTVQAWAEAVLPNGNIFGPVFGPQTLTLGPGQTLGPVTLEQAVPGAAPAGSYLYRANLGTFPSNVIASDDFPVEKSGASSREADHTVDGWAAEQVDGPALLTGASHAIQTAATRSEAYTLDVQAYPTPFSGTTTFTLSLPSEGEVRLMVYDALGRTVGTLDEGPKPAGHHDLQWDASGLPSGVYFYRLDAAQGSRTGSLVKVN